MNEPLTLRYDIDGENFTSAGEASVKVKKALRQLGFSQEIIRRVSIAIFTTTWTGRTSYLAATQARTSGVRLKA